MAGDDTTHGGVIAITTVFTALALGLVVLRLFARFKKVKSLTVDDYLIVAAVFFMILTVSVPTWILAANSHLGDHMVIGPGGHPMPPTYAFNVVLRILQTTHVIPITLAKLSILFFYRRIFRGPSFNAISWAMILVSALWGVSFFFSILFECTPIDLSLVQPPTSPMLKCIDQRANFWGLSASDFLIDIIILAIPFPFVWRLQMSNAAKAGVSAMFLLGILTIAASIARLVIFLNAGNLLAQNDPDFTYYVAPTAYVVCIECSLAIVSACLPVLRPLFGGVTLSTLLRSMRNMFSLQSKSSSPSGASSSSTAAAMAGVGTAGDYSELASVKQQQQQKKGTGRPGFFSGAASSAGESSVDKQYYVSTTVDSPRRNSMARSSSGIVVEHHVVQEERRY